MSIQPHASLRARLVSNGIDILVAGALVQPVIFLLLLSVAWVEGHYFPQAHEHLKEISGTDWFGMLLKYIGGLVFPLLWVWRTRSPGKRMRRLWIVDAHTGERMTLWQALLRYTVYFAIAMSGYVYWWDYSTADAVGGVKPHLEYPIAATFLLPLLSIPFTAKRQGLHDLIARTVVVYAKPHEAHKAQTPQTPAGKRVRIAKELLALMLYYWFIVILIILVNTPFIGMA